MTTKFVLCNGIGEGIDFLVANYKLQVYQQVDFISLSAMINELLQVNFLQETTTYIISNFILDKKEYDAFETFLQQSKSLPYIVYFLVDNSESAFVKFIQNAFKKEVISIPKLDNKLKLSYVNEFIKNNNLQAVFSSELIELLLEILPNDFVLCFNELNKLKLLSSNSINEYTLVKVIYNNDEINLFVLSEAILSKKYDLVFKLLKQNHDDKFLLKLIALLGNYIYKLIMFKLINAKNSALLNKLFPNFYEIKKLQNLQKIYNISNLKMLNKSLLYLDSEFKTAKITDLYNAFRFEILKWKEEEYYV